MNAPKPPLLNTIPLLANYTDDDESENQATN
jgi:hypothetical protein